MKKILITLLSVLLSCRILLGQEAQHVSIPEFNDQYSRFVKQLESGQTNINYREFRESFLKSKQFKIAAKRATRFDSLKKEMYTQMKNPNPQNLIGITKAMLNIDYTSMIAHKILRQTYQITGDTANAEKYKAIQFGLLNSILDNGDGTTCVTAWPVIQVTEEYFILEMMGAELQQQSIVNEDGLCDRMDVKTEDGMLKTYYFEVSKVFEGYGKLRR